MHDNFHIGMLKASQDVTVHSFETQIRGEVYPFVSSFKRIEFSLTIKERGDKPAHIESNVSMNATMGGAELAQYLRAVEAAKQWIEETECFAINLKDHSDAAYGITKALSEGNMRQAYRLVTLLTNVKSEMPKRSNWNYRQTNGRHDHTIIDAIMFHESFTSILESMQTYFKLVQAEDYVNINSPISLKYAIGHTLIVKAGLDMFDSSHDAAHNLAIATLVSEGHSIQELKKGGSKRELVDAKIAELIDAHPKLNVKQD